MSPAEDFNKWLSEDLTPLEYIIKSKGITVAEVSRHAGVSRPTIYKLFHLKSYKTARYATLAALAKALDVTVADLVKDNRLDYARRERKTKKVHAT